MATEGKNERTNEEVEEACTTSEKSVLLQSYGKPLYYTEQSERKGNLRRLLRTEKVAFSEAFTPEYFI